MIKEHWLAERFPVQSMACITSLHRTVGYIAAFLASSECITGDLRL